MRYYDPADPRLGDLVFHTKEGNEKIFDIRNPAKLRDNVGVVCEIMAPNHGVLLQYGIKVMRLDGSVSLSSSREWMSFKVLENFVIGYAKEKDVVREKLEVLSENLLRPKPSYSNDAPTQSDSDVDISM